MFFREQRKEHRKSSCITNFEKAAELSDIFGLNKSQKTPQNPEGTDYTIHSTGR